MRCRTVVVTCLSLALATGCQFSTSSRGGAATTAAAKDRREVTGRIASYTTAPRGEMDGFVLDTGNRVHFPVHAGSTLLPHIQKGTEVRVVGTLVDRPEGKVIEAISITNTDSDKTIAINEITPPRAPEPSTQGGGVKPPGKTESTTTLTGAELTSREGRVRGYTTAPNGDMDGVLLDTGVRVHFPTNAGKAVLPHVGQGKTVRVIGWEITGPEGTILEATKITAPNGPTVDIAAVAAPKAPAVTPGAVAPPGERPLEQAPPATKVR